MSQASRHSYRQEPGIDSRDRWRIGGPGELPRWPLATGHPTGCSPEMNDAAVTVATDRLFKEQCEWEKVVVCSRVVRGETPTKTDDTLLIYVSMQDRHRQLIPILNDLINALYEMGFQGRVEMIDPRAMGGPKSFPPMYSTIQQGRWPSLLRGIMTQLNDSSIDWR